ncbi:MAG: hypothetical protein ACE5D7_01425 [Fidelibacterota bacterium]
MNLRTKFLWNIIILLALIATGYTGYHLYGIYQEKSTLWETYNTETTGTDKELSEKVRKLEDKLLSRAFYKFKIKNIPTDLTKVIAIDGVDFANYGVSNLRFSAGISGNKQHAIAQFRDQTIKVAVGDSIAGGVVEKISSTEVVFLKDGERVTHLLVPKLDK